MLAVEKPTVTDIALMGLVCAIAVYVITVLISYNQS